jgi:hypothetical protein
MATYIIEQNKIFREVDMLSRADQFYLLSHLAKTLAKSEVPKYNLASLKGLGKGLWTKDGIDNFISKERKSWD